jgi:hypothetical protein
MAKYVQLLLSGENIRLRGSLNDPWAHKRADRNSS